MPTNSSTSSSSGAPLGPAFPGLSGWLCALVAVGTLGGLEFWASTLYTAPGALQAHATEAARVLGEPGPHVFVFGTCLAEQALDIDPNEPGHPSDYDIRTIAAAGTWAMDWYFALRAASAQGAPDLAVLVWGLGDLDRTGNPWQEQALDLIDPEGLGEVADIVCATPECRVELYARRYSRLYRYRPYLANWLWTGVGARTARPPATSAPEGANSDGGGQQAAHAFLYRFAEYAQARGIPLALAHLPPNPTSPEAQHEGEQAAERVAVQAALRSRGVEIWPTVDLGGADFEDAMHLGEAGKTRFTRDLLDRVRANLSARGQLSAEAPAIDAAPPIAPGPAGPPLGPDGTPLYPPEPASTGATPLRAPTPLP